MSYGTPPPPPGWQPGLGYGPPGYPAPPPPRPSRAPRLWLAASGVVVVAAVVVIALVLTGGGSGGGQQAGGTTPPPGSSTPAPTSASTSPSPSPTSSAPTTPASTPAGGTVSVGLAPGQRPPTTDALPNNSASSSCDKSGYPDLVSVSVVTVLGLATKGETPNSFVQGVLRDCTSATVRTKIPELFGTNFDYHTGSDLTGKDGQGATAVYLLHDKAGGSASLRLTLTRQRDGHYEITSYVYTP